MSLRPRPLSRHKERPLTGGAMVDIDDRLFRAKLLILKTHASVSDANRLAAKSKELCRQSARLLKATVPVLPYLGSDKPTSRAAPRKPRATSAEILAAL